MEVKSLDDATTRNHVLSALLDAINYSEINGRAEILTTVYREIQGISLEGKYEK